MIITSILMFGFVCLVIVAYDDYQAMQQSILFLMVEQKLDYEARAEEINW